MINEEALEVACKQFVGAKPFDHVVVDDFFDLPIAQALANEFLPYDSEKWFYYKNPIEDKKALNDWNAFPPLTYKVLQYLNSEKFLSLIADTGPFKLYPDNGLHGGGWHIHAAGGNLNPHMDYSVHPKLGLQRKLNLIVYLGEQMEEQFGGHLGLWSHDAEANGPGELQVEVAPKFNRAILFDTTQNSWHGMSRPLSQPDDIYRKSLAVYYLVEPVGDVDPRGRALFAARDHQKGDDDVERIIKLRSDVSSSSAVYKTDK